jgi:hypothetical protein
MQDGGSVVEVELVVGVVIVVEGFIVVVGYDIVALNTVKSPIMVVGVVCVDATDIPVMRSNAGSWGGAFVLDLAKRLGRPRAFANPTKHRLKTSRTASTLDFMNPLFFIIPTPQNY